MDWSGFRRSVNVEDSRQDTGDIRDPLQYYLMSGQRPVDAMRDWQYASQPIRNNEMNNSVDAFGVANRSQFAPSPAAPGFQKTLDGMAGNQPAWLPRWGNNLDDNDSSGIMAPAQGQSQSVGASQQALARALLGSGR